MNDIGMSSKLLQANFQNQLKSFVSSQGAANSIGSGFGDEFCVQKTQN